MTTRAWRYAPALDAGCRSMGSSAASKEAPNATITISSIDTPADARELVAGGVAIAKIAASKTNNMILHFPASMSQNETKGRLLSTWFIDLAVRPAVPIPSDHPHCLAHANSIGRRRCHVRSAESPDSR